MTFPFQPPNFSLSKPMACPYVPGRVGRRVYTHLADSGDSVALNDALNQVGFRRSHSVAYRPDCIGCTDCVSVRVRARDFRPSRTQKRLLRNNEDIMVQIIPAHASEEQYALLKHYLAARHSEGGMDDMSRHDYAAMVGNSPVNSCIVEYRDPESHKLIACCLTDIHKDGLSMIYSFYDTANSHRKGLGSYAILDHIALSAEIGLPYVYLGYWVQKAKRMAYKASYRPLEQFTASGWQECQNQNERNKNKNKREEIKIKNNDI